MSQSGPVVWSIREIIFTGATTGETFSLPVTVENFPTLDGYEDLTHLALYTFRAIITGGAATVTPWMKNGTWPVLITQPSSAAYFDVADSGLEFAQLPFQCAVGSTLTVCLGPNVTGSGILRVGIGPRVASWR